MKEKVVVDANDNEREKKRVMKMMIVNSYDSTTR